jgi:hypothetical protein
MKCTCPDHRVGMMKCAFSFSFRSRGAIHVCVGTTVLSSCGPSLSGMRRSPFTVFAPKYSGGGKHEVEST